MIHESTVRVMNKQNLLKFEFRVPKPTKIRLEGSCLTFLRGREPQDDSVLEGRSTIQIYWSDVTGIYFPKLFGCAIRISLRKGNPAGQVIWIQWLTNSIVEPYNASKTIDLFKKMKEFWENAVGTKYGKIGNNLNSTV